MLFELVVKHKTIRSDESLVKQGVGTKKMKDEDRGERVCLDMKKQGK